jgi:MoaA/NifB/PqqE/SkfB family radical SAM enzyme
MPSIAITIDSKCNASCTHCCFSSNPKSEERLSDARIIELVDEAILSPGVDEIGISGGEALLRPGLVMEIIRRVHQAGKRSTLVTKRLLGPQRGKSESPTHGAENRRTVFADH